ncbi:MarR family winged helix-turn-helix transcriptional regulator [Paenibacillus sp. N3.4]|uniref:MarR family winged helix-turn-helix transcriptional regulator n=1 Tax=Paenibacillus sp. N3.4 TaxID=2603222 RepID=UPI0011CC8AF1|nr:MarR family transcriptional regulator [Paenibacillus sp. N3.4]TXK84491.1 MarR family transcriptional regulator [Paenibacillus sp. N3.4]
MEPKDALKLENQICFAVYACSREMTKLYRPILEQIGLTYTQYVTMLALWEKDSVTVTEIGNRLYLDSGTLTPLLKKLESMALLTRTRDRSDERSVVITLTDKGRALRETAQDIPNQLSNQVDMDPEEAVKLREQVMELLHKVQQCSESTSTSSVTNTTSANSK